MDQRGDLHAIRVDDNRLKLRGIAGVDAAARAVVEKVGPGIAGINCRRRRPLPALVIDDHADTGFNKLGSRSVAFRWR